MRSLFYKLHATLQTRLFFNLTGDEFDYRPNCIGYNNIKIITRSWKNDKHCLFLHKSIPDAIKSALRDSHTQDLTPEFVEEISGLSVVWHGSSYLFNPYRTTSRDMYSDVVVDGDSYKLYKDGQVVSSVVPNQTSMYVYEMRAWTHEAYRRCGYATQAVRACAANEHKLLFYSHHDQNVASAGVIKALVRSGEAQYAHASICYGEKIVL